MEHQVIDFLIAGRISLSGGGLWLIVFLVPMGLVLWGMALHSAIWHGAVVARDEANSISAAQLSNESPSTRTSVTDPRTVAN
ncbi:hypothetical protein [Secundilactobacillus paracollinoides]|uniref:hypothetical protein n=1 Tax=Secundilactobacillus paracollinoides TaxID=240427 RepID=UPI0012E2852C|nr:hypothetical protein [Secundilactobacillus paracollinoides]